MSTDVLIGDGETARLAPHSLRAAVLGEVHARPFTPITAAFIPVAGFAIWWTVRRIRKKHIVGEE